jgi:hypothetical protein
MAERLVKKSGVGNEASPATDALPVICEESLIEESHSARAGDQSSCGPTAAATGNTASLRGSNRYAGSPRLTSKQVATRFADLEEEKATRLSELLRHYAFRLFLRGAIQKGQGFAPQEATQYLKRSQSRECAESLVRLGLAERSSRSCYRLVWGREELWRNAGVVRSA